MPSAFPIFIWELQGRPQGLYGFPALDGREGGVKVGTEQFEVTTTADAADPPVSSQAVAAVHAEFVAPFLRGLAARCVKVVSCLYTVTSDFGFVIDRHPDCESVLVVAACSGHGLKHSPAIGEAAEAWDDEGIAPFARAPFRFARFTDLTA